MIDVRWQFADTKFDSSKSSDLPALVFRTNSTYFVLFFAFTSQTNKNLPKNLKKTKNVTF